MRSKLVTAMAAAVAVSGCLLKTPDRAPQRAHPRTPAVDPNTDSIGVTWIGHATVLIRMRDRWFLTDPVLGKRIAGILPRNIEPGIHHEDLPPLDAVLISHAHFDHLDIPSLRKVTPVPLLVLPSGATKYIPDDLETRDIAALAVWEQWTRDGVTITAVPASHGDGRYLVDRWSHETHTGYVIEYQGLSVYFAGDTGYSKLDAEAIRERFAIDVALIPVGPAGRSKWLENLRRDVHVTPDDAMELFAACGAQWMVPIHYDTFFKDPGVELPHVERAIERADQGRRVRVLGIGETTQFIY